MRRRIEIAAAATLMLLTAGCGRGHGESEPAAAGGLPPLAGRFIGPQPGPNRPLAQASNPYGMDPTVLAEGRRLFIWFNCYGCHGGRAGGGMGPSLRDPDWLYGNSDQAIFNSIAEGRQYGMPAWGTKLPDEQMWKITAYIKSMGTEAEPDAPPANPVLPRMPPNPVQPGVQARLGGG
jgi:cytochrome c oxidase cbb3-type subunit III